ncbi:MULTISPECIES: nicotinate-nucleotide--dimethylbenzimidazole phosphoribosyltransferase [unclassified Luteococcus]|uniref:nicotinate-nucleotide--dimethylbenzimidazole phosphoribosyltransferase n=1 Tax=unclassified Luteococcus TaxID=2639923 RepID=UPI00313AF32E
MTENLRDVIAAITPVDEEARAAAEARQLTLTKPPGSLGELEALGNQLAAIAGACPPPVPEPALVCVFAGDHGVQAQKVSPWPQEVTVQMAANISAGGAGVSVITRAAGGSLKVFDVGMLSAAPGTVDAVIARGTRDFTVEPAMTDDECERAIEVGLQAARQAVAEGFRALVPGEVGIGNTTPSSALTSLFTGVSVAEVTGRGSGADDDMLARKGEVIQRGFARHGLSPESAAADPLRALACVGGFEHAAMVGLILGAAEQRVPLVLDGAIACSAALVAVALCPAAHGYLIAGHAGVEPGIQATMARLGLQPVIRLDLRLGEGSGGALALPVVATAARILREMATFDSAGVTGEYE